MTLACTRALRICALLALPVTAFAQTSRSPTIFSPTTQMGTVNLRAAVVLADYTVKPLPLLKVVARRTDRPDSVAGQTDLDGRLSMPLRVGTYTIRAKAPQPVEGRAFAWNVRVVVRSQKMEAVQLTNANASSSDSVETTATVVAAAPKPAVIVEKPVATKPAPPKIASTKPVESPKVVAAKPSPEPAVEKPAERVSQSVDRTSVVSEQPAPAPANPFVTPAASSPKPARVQRPAPRARTSGLMLGLSFDASAIRSDDLTSSTESGAGAAAQLGWGFTRNFAMVVDASAARISSLDGDFDLGHLDVGGRWNFVGSRSPLVPFVEVGYSGRVASKQDALLSDGGGNMYTGDLAILGGGVSLGGGFHYFVGSRVAIGGAFKWTKGSFSQVKVDNVTVDGLDIDATSARFNMGFTWFPMGK